PIFLFIRPRPATSEIYTLSLHDALPIYHLIQRRTVLVRPRQETLVARVDETRVLLRQRRIIKAVLGHGARSEILDHHVGACRQRSEEHTSELQSRENLVCRLLLEKKKKK